MPHPSQTNCRAASHAKFALLSVSYLALNFSCAIPAAQAQSAQGQGQGAGTLPSVTVAPPETRRRSGGTSAARTTSAARSRRTQTARRPETVAEPKPFAQSQDARTGAVGVYANSTSVATKTNTPLVNIPQSLSVITKILSETRPPRTSPTSPVTFRASRCTRAKATATNS